MRKFIFLATLALTACIPTVADDSGMQAVQSNDTTGILSGCDTPVSVGFLYCRFPEGWAPLGEIIVLVPDTKCGLDSCAQVIVFRPDGSRAVERSATAGQNFVIVPWRSLVGDAPLQRNRRGYWPVLVQWQWLNKDGLIEQAAAEAEIRLRVYASAYSPLGTSPSRWRWSHASYTIRATEKGRMSAEAK